METADLSITIAQTAAALVVGEGLSMESAKKRALKHLGLPLRTRLPSNGLVEDAIAEHIQLFCAETQPSELLALRQLAVKWMEKLAAFQPLVGGAVWKGTATRLSDIHLQLFAVDTKAPVLWLLNEGIDYDIQEGQGLQGHTVEILSFSVACAELQEYISIHLWINETQSQRGALLPNHQNKTTRGNAAALRSKLQET